MVRGNDGLVSTTQSRSGSAAARCSSATDAPAWSDRLIQPSASGVVAAVVITRGAICSRAGANRRKSAGTNSTLAPLAMRNRSAGPKNPLSNETLGRVKSS